MRVAIIHYWLVGMRGGENVLESLCRLYPNADIFTHCLDREKLSAILSKRSIRTTFINNLPLAKTYYKYYLPFMPLALEQLDLRGYDLVISSESGPAKGVIVHSTTPHICYCHTPMRYLWDYYQDYLDTKNILVKTFMRGLFHYMRLWDIASAARPDMIIANSHAVSRRIQRCWGKPARVVYPPVEVESFSPVKKTGDYYLCFGEMVDYKRVDLAIYMATKTGRKLIVAGDGEGYHKLQKIAGSTVTFTGRVSHEVRTKLLAECRALLFPGEEDFGIIPVEVMAAGRPVIAYGKGGALETVKDGVTGFFFHEQTLQGLIGAIELFEQNEHLIDSEAIVKHAAQFNEKMFHKNFLRAVKDCQKNVG